MIFFRNLYKIKVGFLIIGAQKAGTSSLDHYLRQHPEIGMARNKEVHFFNNEKVFSKSKINYNLLEKQFDYNRNIKIFGEITPIYIYWEPSIKRIWNYNNNIKLITILRNPIDRAFSHWNMEYCRKRESEDFFYCIKNENERIDKDLSFENQVYSYTKRGFYSEQIERIQKFFPPEQLLFIKYEDYVKNQEEILKKVFNFLEVDADNYQFSFQKVRTANYSRTMTSGERSYLLNLFSDDINKVECLLGWDCDDWKK